MRGVEPCWLDYSPARPDLATRSRFFPFSFFQLGIHIWVLCVYVCVCVPFIITSAPTPLLGILFLYFDVELFIQLSSAFPPSFAPRSLSAELSWWYAHGQMHISLSLAADSNSSPHFPRRKKNKKKKSLLFVGSFYTLICWSIADAIYTDSFSFPSPKRINNNNKEFSEKRAGKIWGQATIWGRSDQYYYHPKNREELLTWIMWKGNGICFSEKL